MDSTVLTVKFVLILAMEVFVVAAMGAMLALGLYRLLRQRYRKLRALKPPAPEGPLVSSAGASVVHRP